jgi:hypothetical protein
MKAASRLGMLGLWLIGACGRDTPPPPPPSTTVPASTTPAAEAADELLERSGTLSPGPGGAEGRAGFDLAVRGGDQLVVDLESTGFDPVLAVQLPDGSSLSNDDFQGSRSRSHLELVSRTQGTMKVVVQSYVEGATGAFHLTVQRVRRPSPGLARIVASNFGGAAPGNEVRSGAAQVAPPSSSGRAHHQLPQALGGGASIAVGRTVDGTLGGGEALPSGEPMAVFLLDGVRAGQTFTVDLRAAAFDPYLLLSSPNGQLWENDDAGGTRDSRLTVTASAPGTYRIVVSAYRAGMGGPFQLAISDGRFVPPPASAGGSGEARAIPGVLAMGDQQLTTGELYDVHELSLAAGERLDVEARSTDFDTYLIVVPPGGQQQENDDQAQGDTNAALHLVASVAGRYRVIVTSYRSGESGRYQLVVGSGGGVAAQGAGGASAEAPGVEPPASPGGGRVFAVLAGISDYPGDANDLPECANDARKLDETLGRRGLLEAQRRIVLTDADATRANLTAAMARMATEVGPDDVFLFFYSGHGAQGGPGSRDAREIDGRDEAIVLHDGELVDDELGRMLDRLRARVAITALDSCYSGGFAKDVITRPGRVGLFSSEEDVLSAVASQFQAGGYLSHFMRMALSGDADADPSDGLLTVGELTHFVYRQFAQQATDVQLQGAYQQLVVDRGAVSVEEPLWRYR